MTHARTCARRRTFFQQAVTASLATLASFEGPPGPAAALAWRTGGLLLIDDFTLVGLAGKYAGRSGATRLRHPQLEAEQPPVLRELTPPSLHLRRVPRPEVAGPLWMRKVQEWSRAFATPHHCLI